MAKYVENLGLRIQGLKKASGDTENYCPYSGKYNEIFYNVETGCVWTKFQFSLGQNSSTRYDNPAIIKICNTTRHLTMSEITDLIVKKVSELDLYH